MLADRRTKIVATIGPATCSKDNLEKAIRAGMNVARLNFSHGDHALHLEVLKNVRELSMELRAPVAVLQDLQGPKIRVGKLINGQVTLKEGAHVQISTEIELGTEEVLSTDFKELPAACQPGTRILLDDGLLELVVTGVVGPVVSAKVIFGGVLKDRKGMNLPGARLPVECLTEKDYEDLEFGLKHDVDYVALSFVRRGADIDRLREIINARRSNAKIIAKIEMLEALEDLINIIAKSDAVMVARGDLAVEAGQTQLPRIQKQIIKLCNEMGKPVITATQMLDSMVENPRPTRAEITDVANAVLDGSDALMLSAESASGKYPFKCIETMHEIILEVEKTGSIFYSLTTEAESIDVAESIGASATFSALKLNAAAIVCLSTTGRTAAMISHFRPKSRLIAVTHVPEVLNRLELVWGIQTLLVQPYHTTEEVMEQIESQILLYGLAQPGDKIIMTLGLPVHQGAKTNSLRVFTLGQGRGLGRPTEIPLRYRS